MHVQSTRVFSRWQAAGLHLTASFTLAILAALLLFGVWYPQPYTQAAGADRLIMLLIGIDLVLGPLLTLIVYKHGKKGMAFDIAFIATVQVAALVYGMSVIAQSRPVFVVVSKDMTFLTTAIGVSDEDLAAAKEPAFGHRSWTGPVLVAAPEPDTAKGREELMESGLAGKDINALPRFFAPFAKAGAGVIRNSLPFGALTAHASTRVPAESFAAERGLAVEDLYVQPLRGSDPEKDLTIVFDLRDQSVVGVIAVDPWPAIEAHKSQTN